MLLSSCKPGKSVNFNFNPNIDTTNISEPYTLYNNVFDDEQIPNQWPRYGIGDPFVYRFNGTYYLYPSTSQSGVRGYKSIDLMQWEPVTGEGLPYGYVLSPDYRTESAIAYAPEVTYHNGWFYLCESQAGTGHYFFRSRSPEGPFVKYTGNIGESIDGSFFIDDDGKAYFLRAKAEAIRIVRFNDDFTLSNDAFDIENTSMGGWTEGPYVLKRDGTYFLTFTGVHVASHGYKVGYSYLQDSDTVFNRYGYKRAENILMNTDDEWHTLGHSSTTLGPDMDSYYIAYHSRSNGIPGRQFNLSRLLFNGTDMKVDRPALNGTLVPKMPEFYSFNPENDLQKAGNFELTLQKTGKTFTAEYNFIGNNPNLIFSYIDEKNYHFVSTDGRRIVLHEVKSGQQKKLHEVLLDKQYDMEALHHIRVSYKDSNLNIVFDNMEKVRNFNVTLAPGKIGHHGSHYEKHYIAFSNVAQGTSDERHAKQEVIFAPSYLKDVSSLKKSSISTIANDSNDEAFNGFVGSNLLTLNGPEYASYRIFANNSSHYNIEMTVPNESLGKKIALKVDNDEPIEFIIPSVPTSSPFVNVSLGNIPLSAGMHYLSVLNRQNSGFTKMLFTPTEVQSTVYENSLTENTSDLLNRGSQFTYSEEGLVSGNTRGLVYLLKEGFNNVEIEVSLRFDEASSIYSSGVILRAKNDAYGEWDDNNSLQGYYFGVKNTQAFLVKADYQAMSTQLAINFARVPSFEFTKLKIIAKDNTFSFYVNGEEEFVVTDPLARFGGRIGLYTTGVKTTFKDLVITPL